MTDISVEYSKAQAAIIEQAKPYLHLLDIPYLKEALKKMKGDLRLHQSVGIIFLGRHQPAKEACRAKEIEALEHLINYIEASKALVNLRKAVVAEKEQNDMLTQLFDI